jgi:hypothetical protein
MSSKVGALLIDMAMNTAAFASDLSKSTNNLNSWAANSNKTLAGVVMGYRGLSKELSNFTANTFTLRNAVVTLAGGGALGLLINKSLEAASAIVDTADNVGVSTKTLQEYTYAARLSAIGTDQLQNAMKTFSTQLGQAHAGAGKLYTFLKASNPVLLQQVTSAKSVDEALNATFATMGKLGSQTDRLALASAAFGKKNLEMVNLVKDGVPAFEALRQKANDLGIVIRDDLLRNAEDAGDKIDTLSQVFHAQLITAVAENATEIGHFAEELTKAIPVVVSLATEALHFVNILSDNWKPTIIGIGLILDDMIIALEKAGATIKTFSPFKDVAEEGKRQLADLNELSANIHKEAEERVASLSNKTAEGAQTVSAATQAATAAAEDYQRKMKAAADAATEAENKFKKLQAAADKIKQDGQGAFTNYINDLAQLDEMLKKNLITWEEYGNAVKAAQEKNLHTSERTKKVLGDTQTAQEKYNDQMKELNQLRGVEGGLSEEQYQQAVAKTNAELRKSQMEGSLVGSIMDKAIDGNIKSWKDLGSAVVDFGKTMLKSLASGQGFDGKGGGIGSLLGGAGSLIGSLFGTSAGSTSPSMFSQASTWLSTLFAHSGGVVGSSGLGSRRVDPAVFSGAPRFHNGGLVGGEVPIIAKKGERVLTEQQQRDGMKPSVTYVIDARGAAAGVEQELRQMILELNNSVESRAVKAVSGARARNPSLFSGT